MFILLQLQKFTSISLILLGLSLNNCVSSVMCLTGTCTVSLYILASKIQIKFLLIQQTQNNLSVPVLCSFQNNYITMQILISTNDISIIDG